MVEWNKEIIVKDKTCIEGIKDRVGDKSNKMRKEKVNELFRDVHLYFDHYYPSTFVFKGVYGRYQIICGLKGLETITKDARRMFFNVDDWLYVIVQDRYTKEILYYKRKCDG